MKVNFREELTLFDQAVRAGRIANVRRSLSSPVFRNPPRELRKDYAMLARRIGRPDLGLRFLSPVVRPKTALASEAHPTEKAAYALCLAGAGALTEAVSLVNSFGDLSIAETQLAAAFVLIHHWDYELAIPHLERYLTLPTPTEYQRMIARVNLGAAYNFTGHPELGADTAAQTSTVCRESGWGTLAYESHLIAAQAATQLGRWTDARDQLRQAREATPSMRRVSELLTEKWSVLIDLGESGPSANVIEQAAQLRRAAEETQAWEIGRDLDYYFGLRTRDRDRLALVYYGTPFPAYRERLRKAARDLGDFPQSFAWQPAGASDLELDLAGPGPAEVWRTLRALTGDFYRPFRIGALFSSMFPGELFHPESSPNRVRQTLTRVRRWLASENIPMQIAREPAGYVLKQSSPVRLQIATSYGPVILSERESGSVSLLRQRWPSTEFTSREAAELLGTSVRQARRLLLDWEEKQFVTRHGSTQDTSFAFTRTKKAA